MFRYSSYNIQEFSFCALRILGSGLYLSPEKKSIQPYIKFKNQSNQRVGKYNYIFSTEKVKITIHWRIYPISRVRVFEFECVYLFIDPFWSFDRQSPL
jgi:hypothetical protein